MLAAEFLAKTSFANAQALAGKQVFANAQALVELQVFAETQVVLVVALLVLIPLVLFVAILFLLLRLRAHGFKGYEQSIGQLRQQLEAAQLKLEGQQQRLESFDSSFVRIDGLIRDEFGRNREEASGQQQKTREETSKTLRENREELGKQFKEIRESMEMRLGSMQTDNAAKLEEMRKTVDEKLQETVEKRFSESFALISTRLEEVHKGLGEMQSLASGVSDLNNVLSNVKARGTFGEYQLAAILEQFLSPEQYLINAQTKKRSQERVEFAIKLPGRSEDGTVGTGSEVLLPIDSKFPIEDYERLLDAYEGKGDAQPEEVIKRLVVSLKTFAREIRNKYINPPITTEFAIMFVPTEGLYAEILRIPGLSDSLQRDFQVAVVGPTNLVAFLNSLQMGFRTLAVEKRSSEVWTLLGQVKNEFGKFAGVLENVKKKLDAAASEIDKVETRTRGINRRLRKVQELPYDDTAKLLETETPIGALETDETDEGDETE